MKFSRVSAHLKCNKQSWGKTINFIHKSVARFALANDRKRQGKLSHTSRRIPPYVKAHPAIHQGALSEFSITS